MTAFPMRAAILMTALLAPVPALAQPGPLSDLDWLAGAWLLERPGERLEERWSGPHGDSMVGHFRWIRNGELWITELLSITAEAGEVVFRLRHFDAGMRPWEAADDPFVYRLAERGPGRVSFEMEEDRPERPSRFVFEALPGDSLLVRLDATDDGRPVTRDFRYGRARAANRQQSRQVAPSARELTRGAGLHE